MTSIEGLTQLAQEQTELIEAQMRTIETVEAERDRARAELKELRLQCLVDSGQQMEAAVQQATDPTPAVQASAPSVTVDTPEWRHFLDDWFNTCDKGALVAYIDRYTAAVVAKAVAEKDEEILALHRKLAGETLRADQGWARYEQANKSRIALEMEKASAPQQHAQAAQPQCFTCSGHGLIGGLMPGDGGYHSEDCPACDGTGVAAPAQPIAGELPPYLGISEPENERARAYAANYGYQCRAAVLEGAAQVAQAQAGSVSMFAKAADARTHNNAVTCCVRAISALNKTEQ